MSLRRLLALAFVLFAFTGCSTAQPVAAQSPHGRGEAFVDTSKNLETSSRANASPRLPADLSGALTHEYGNYGDVVTWDGLLNDLENAEVVCIGEAHYEARDMETAFEIARTLAARRKIALAVERFSYVLQPKLDRLTTFASESQRDAHVDDILRDTEYQTVWGSNSFDQTGFPVNTPSQPVFEAMVKWAARSRIPLIALDVSLADQENGLGEEMAWRNEFWKQEIEKFRANHPNENYQIVVIGGIQHMTNAPNAFPSKLKSDSMAQVISIGQRDAMYHYLSSTKVETFAKTYSFDDLIIRHPEFALVNVKGVATFPQPPDYWIAAHLPQ